MATHRPTTRERPRQFGDEAGAVGGGDWNDELREGRLFRRDLVRWGPIVAGLLVTITTLVVLGALGLAIGFEAFAPGETGLASVDTAGYAWGIFTAVAAFFLGGFAAARMSAVGGPGRGALNGVMVAVLGITATVLLVGLGVGNVLGAAAANLADVADVGAGIDLSVEDVAVNEQAVFDAAQDAAWGTFTALAVSLVVATVGGVAGARRRADDELVRGER